MRLHLPEIGWNPSQRRAMLVFSSILLLALGIRSFLNRQEIPDPQPPQGIRASELASRLDPNTADWQSLSAIPNLGAKRAKDIAAYRDQIRSSDPNATVFRSSSDLMHVKGIGPATAANLEPYLQFPTAPPAK